MKIVNLTPHPVTLDCGIFGEEHPYGEPHKLTLQPSGEVARVKEQIDALFNCQVDNASGEHRSFCVKMYSRSFGQVEGLPEPAEDTLYLVSSVVKAAVLDRKDVVTLVHLHRDEEGKVIGAGGIATS